MPRLRIPSSLRKTNGRVRESPSAFHRANRRLAFRFLKEWIIEQAAKGNNPPAAFLQKVYTRNVETPSSPHKREAAMEVAPMNVRSLCAQHLAADFRAFGGVFAVVVGANHFGVFGGNNRTTHEHFHIGRLLAQ